MRVSDRFRSWHSVFTAAVVVFVAGLSAPALAAPDRYTVEVVEAIEQVDTKPASGSERGAFPSPNAQGFDFDLSIPRELEPNNDTASAQALTLASGAATVRGDITFGDTDVYSIQAAAGDRIYAGVATGSAVGGNSTLVLLASDGTTVIETDLDDGSLGTTSSTIAGATLASAGTYYLRITASTATALVAPYRLYVQTRSGVPTPETEPNNNAAPPNGPQLLPAGNWVSGVLDPVADTDVFLISLNAGDTMFVAADLDPERDAIQFNQVRLGVGLLGTTASTITVFNDTSVGSATNPLSESYYFTAKVAGQYWIYLDASAAAGNGPTSTYHVSATVFPFVPATGSCTTYTSTNVPVTIPADLSAGTTPVTSTIVVPGNPRVADIDVEVDITHTFMQDLDVQLISPAGNDNGLFNDIGAATVGGPQTGMKIRFDDEAGSPPFGTFSEPLHLQPQSTRRLSFYDGSDAGGTWTLAIRDDATGDGGTLNGWSITVCEPPPPPTSFCPVGFEDVVVYTTDFEANDGGFTSSGTLNEWERGLPTFNPLTTCASGSNCFVTDLDGNYENSSNQTLVSPPIDLTGLSGPVRVSWNHRYQVETTTFDQYRVFAREVGGANATEAFFLLAPDMVSASIGNPTATVQGSAGWAPALADATAYAGAPMELAFNLTSDSSVPRAGVAIDDVVVRACAPLPDSDLSITKTNGTTTSVPGGSTTYTIVASNAGPETVGDALVTDTFPASLTCNWTCTATTGSSCTAAGSGNIADTASLASGGSATYVAVCGISPSATGTLVNTATVASASYPDPAPGNNSATDTDTLDAQADLSITKTDGVTTVSPGQTSTYTIVASNAGPSSATGATVADTFPAPLTGCTWTCTSAGGGTCTAAGSGNINDTVNLPAGGSTTFIAACTVSPSATGTIANTATVAAPSGTTDPTPGNNSATDTNTVNSGPGGADVSLVIVNDRDFVQMGENVSLTVAVQNSGPDAAPAVTVSGAVPAELTLFSWTCTGLGGATCGSPSGVGSFNTTASIPNGGTVLYAVQGTVSGEDANGSVAFSASAVVEPPVVDPNTANNTDTWTAEVVIFRNGFECTVEGVEGNSCAPTTTVLVDEFTSRYQTAASGGFGGAPVSALQGNLAMTTFGAGAQIVNNNSVADDFVVPAGGWTVERMRFYTYQTGSPVTSTINDLRLRIFANDPNTGTLVFGDTATNRLTSTAFTGVYRVTDTTLTNNQRPTMEMVVEFNPPLVLAAGTYWFAWQAGGTLASGPWAPPQTVIGQTTTGNGQQSIAGAAFAPLTDGGTLTPQGVPFIIEGLQ